LTQTVGARYEIPLASVYISADGDITVTDTREWAEFSTQWGANSVVAATFTNGAVTAAKIPDRARYLIKDAGQLIPDSVAIATWVVGGSYDYWNYADAVTQSLWLNDFVPFDIVGVTFDIYIWTVPNVNGAGGGAENARWEFSYDLSSGEEVVAPTAGNILVDQQARVNTTVYRDLLVTIPAAVEGELIQLQITRAGRHGTDSYASAMRLLGVEFSRTAEA
jgi:hypothetical protein